MTLDREKTELQETGSVMLPRHCTLADVLEIVNDLGMNARDLIITAPNGGYVYIEHWREDES